MTRLEELIYSLAAVIVRYHDSQFKPKKLVADLDEATIREKSLSGAKEIFQNKEIHFKTRLKELIKQCADTGRSHFLHYILHEITSLKALHEKTSSFDPLELEEYEQQIFQLVSNLKLLLDTSKHKFHKITYSKTEPETYITLSGLKNDAYLGNNLCNSGEILKDAVFRQFNITVNSSDELLREIAEQICMEHQHALLVPELLAQNAYQKKINSEQEIRLNELSTQDKENQKNLKTTSIKQVMAFYLICSFFKKLQAHNLNQKKIIEQQQETIKELRQNIMDLKQPVAPKANYSFLGL